MRTRILTGTLLAALASAALVLAAPSAASAHDQLIGGTPFEGDVVAAAPEELTMEFSATLLDVASLVLVMDEDETDWAAGDPQLFGTEVTVPLLPDMPEGVYEVRWQVVSSDGHPISDVFKFGVGDVDPALLEREPLPSGGDNATAAGDDGSADAATADSGDGAVLRTVLIAAGGAAAGLIVFLIILWARRRRPNTSSH